jgi:hypothetical protein
MVHFGGGGGGDDGSCWSWWWFMLVVLIVSRQRRAWGKRQNQVSEAVLLPVHMLFFIGRGCQQYRYYRYYRYCRYACCSQVEVPRVRAHQSSGRPMLRNLPNRTHVDPRNGRAGIVAARARVCVCVCVCALVLFCECCTNQ